MDFITKELVESPEMEQALTFAREILKRDCDSNRGTNLNNVEMPHKCPQCQSTLLFGHGQTACFDCFARLTICYESLEIMLDEQVFISACDLCQANFSRQWLQRMKLSDA